MFREFLGFLVVAGLLINHVTTVTLLILMEFLLDQNFSPSNMFNYMAAIQSQFILYGLDTSFRDERIHLFQKSLTYTRKLCPRTAQIIVSEMLSHILFVSCSLKYPVIFQTLYYFFFVFQTVKFVASYYGFF